MKISRNRLTAVVSISVFGLLLQGCGEPAANEGTTVGQTPTDTQSSEAPLEFDDRIPEVLRTAFVENGWNPGQYIELPEAVEAQEGVDYELVCEYEPDPGSDFTWLGHVVSGSLGEQGDFLMEYEPWLGSGPYGESFDLVYFTGDCSGQTDFMIPKFDDRGWKWLKSDDDYPGNYVAGTRIGDRMFILGADFEPSDNWSIFSFDTSTSIGEVLASNHDVEGHYASWSVSPPTSHIAFNQQAGALTLHPALLNEYGYYGDLGTERQLLWFDLLGSHPVVELGPGSAVAATDGGLYLVQTGLSNGGEIIKFLPNSTHAPNLDTAPSLMSLPADIGYKITGLSASGEKLLVVLHPTTDEEEIDVSSAFALVLDISGNTLSFMDLGSVAAGLNVELQRDIVTIFTHYETDHSLVLDLSTGKLLKSTDAYLHDFVGDYALTRSHLVKPLF